ncbi:MAG: hypothetical protein ACRYE8_07110 [Janthinobacterium lividum]
MSSPRRHMGVNLRIDVIPWLALLRGSKNALGVIPWLVHGIQKIIKNTNFLVFLTGSRE